MEFDLASGMAVLERTPRTVSTMLGGLTSAWTDAAEGPETGRGAPICRSWIVEDGARNARGTDEK